MSPRLFDESVSRSGTIHLYASFNGLGRLVVNVFAPPGFVFQGGYAGPKRGGGEFQNATVIYYERGKLAKYGWSGDLRINFTHIGPTDGAGNYIEQSGAANEIGSRPIGVAGNYGGRVSVGGTGGGGVGTHVHMIFSSTFRGQQVRVDPRRVFCGDMGGSWWEWDGTQLVYR
ncbi:MAG: hypothetical protein IPJ30_12950 [Acidobacteria bacterium]|nr:hypothetical protein [Acidobacteriota bacterium]